MDPAIVKGDCSEARNNHQHREVPQCIVEHARGGGEEDDHARHLVRDGLLRQLNCGQGNHAHGSRVEARQQGVDGAWKRLVDVGYANGQGVHADGAGQAPDQKAQNSRHEAATDQVDAVQHLGAGGPGQRLRDAEQLLEDLLVDPFCLFDEFLVELACEGVSELKLIDGRKVENAKATYNSKVHWRATKGSHSEMPIDAEDVGHAVAQGSDLARYIAENRAHFAPTAVLLV